MNKIKVSICCITYNQENYIKDAIESFLAQKTNFEYEIIIHDDASTDNTPNIIKEYYEKYPNIIVPILQKENQYSKRPNSVLDIVFEKAKGKYISLCEGDDGFCDDTKLQQQYDIFESNKTLSLISHNTKIIDEDANFIENNIPYSKNNITEKDFLNNYNSSMHTSSMMFKKKDVMNLPSYYTDAPVGDLPLKLYLLSIGNGYHINKIMSFYRRNSIGSWTLRQKKDNDILKKNFDEEIEIYNMFNKENSYKYNLEIKNRILYKSFMFNKDNGNLKEIKKDKYRKLYKELSFIEKVKLHLKDNKVIYYIYQKIKYGKRC